MTNQTFQLNRWLAKIANRRVIPSPLRTEDISPTFADHVIHHVFNNARSLMPSGAPVPVATSTDLYIIATMIYFADEVIGAEWYSDLIDCCHDYFDTYSESQPIIIEIGD